MSRCIVYAIALRSVCGWANLDVQVAIVSAGRHRNRWRVQKQPTAPSGRQRPLIASTWRPSRVDTAQARGPRTPTRTPERSGCMRRRWALACYKSALLQPPKQSNSCVSCCKTGMVLTGVMIAWHFFIIIPMELAVCSCRVRHWALCPGKGCMRHGRSSRMRASPR